MCTKGLATPSNGSGPRVCLACFATLIPRDARVSHNLSPMFEVHVADVSLGVSAGQAHQAIVPVEVPPWRQMSISISTATILGDLVQ
jgi:hypothetical protein